MTGRHLLRSPARQKGMAVVSALIVVAAASVATAGIMERQAVLADTLAGERDRAQARWLLRGGLDWARILLLLDARSSAVTLRQAIWAQPISNFQIRDPASGRSATFSGVIEDEQGKFNLQRLAVNGTIRADAVAALDALLTSLNVPRGTAAGLAARVAASQPAPTRAAMAPQLRSVHDLQGVAGLSPDMLAALSPYLTILPGDTPLNVNTAAAEVLSAVIPGLGLAHARQLVEERDRGQWFTSRGDFLNRLDLPVLQGELALDVRSEWFKVSGEVVLDHSRATMQALLRRTGDAPAAVHWIEG